jgi:hypothetical protein
MLRLKKKINTDSTSVSTFVTKDNQALRLMKKLVSKLVGFRGE